MPTVSASMEQKYSSQPCFPILLFARDRSGTFAPSAQVEKETNDLMLKVEHGELSRSEALVLALKIRPPVKMEKVSAEPQVESVLQEEPWTRWAARRTPCLRVLPHSFPTPSTTTT